jgi:hypothetical protein
MARLPLGINKIAIDNASYKNATKALPEAIFDIDDEEDFTAGTSRSAAASIFTAFAFFAIVL